MSKRLSASQRRAQLIDVGRSVFARNGYEGTSVEELARAAGVSKPIVYQHFGGKVGLHAVIVDREMECVVQRVAKAIAIGTPAGTLPRRGSRLSQLRQGPPRRLCGADPGRSFHGWARDELRRLRPG